VTDDRPDETPQPGSPRYRQALGQLFNEGLADKLNPRPAGAPVTEPAAATPAPALTPRPRHARYEDSDHRLRLSLIHALLASELPTTVGETVKIASQLEAYVLGLSPAYVLGLSPVAAEVQAQGLIAEAIQAERTRIAEFLRNQRAQQQPGTASWDTLSWIAGMIESGEAGQVPGDREA